MNLAPVYPIRSERLLLRPLAVADADALVAYRSVPEVCRYVPFDPMDSSTVLARIEGSWSQRTLEREGEALILGADVDTRNTASARLVTRVGMRQEAHLVENERFKGEWTDELDFGLLASEWPSRRLPGCPACEAVR
ncbi:MAG TPA: GNAT family protein [Streptosporangiaceae bacterium]|nr:GNAT family protein [Streptosporangiaceae bacterium]